jgi:branched-subunit amino acid ABC-type transport system permease component
MEHLLQLSVELLIQSSILTLVAISFYLTVSVWKFYDFSLASQLTLAPYALLAFTPRMSLLLSVPSAVACSGLAGFFVGMVWYRIGFRTGSEMLRLIGSVGVFTIIQNAIVVLFGPVSHRLQVNVGVLHIGVLRIAAARFAAAGLALLLVTLTYIILTRTHLGRVFRSIMDAPDLATDIGLPVRFVRLSVSIYSGMIAGAVGILVALDTGLFPYLGLNLFVLAVTATLMGGRTGIKGVVVSSTGISALRVLLSWGGMAEWSNLVVYALLVCFLLFSVSRRSGQWIT